MNKVAHSKQDQLITILVIVMFLSMSILACSFDFNQDQSSQDSTEVAQMVEQTLFAEQAITEQARQTQEAPNLPPTEPEGPDLNATIQAQQATLDAQITPTSPVISETPTPTDLPVVSIVEPISLSDWETKTLRQAAGCGEDKNGPPCWFGRGAELNMMLPKPILIDAAWENPYLTFSHHYVFVQNATIYAKADGGWEVLWSFLSGQSSLWKPFQVDLSKYKGKEIILQFIVSGTAGTMFNSGQKNEWYIRDPQIIPNFDPYQ